MGAQRGSALPLPDLLLGALSGLREPAPTAAITWARLAQPSATSWTTGEWPAWQSCSSGCGGVAVVAAWPPR